MDGVEADGKFELIVFEWKAGDISLLKTNILEVACFLFGDFYHIAGKVDANNIALRKFLSQNRTEITTARAGVQNSLGGKVKHS